MGSKKIQISSFFILLISFLGGTIEGKESKNLYDYIKEGEQARLSARYQEALESYNQALSIAKKIGDLRAVADV